MPMSAIEGYRLSPQQQRLWGLQQMTPHAPYHVQCSVSISGKLDRTRWNAALQAVAQRYEILRTRFYGLPEMILPSQVIGDHAIVAYHHEDLSHLPEQAQTEQLTEWWQQWQQRPLDLDRDAVLDVTLITLSPTQHQLLIQLPALCTDAVSLKNLVREIAEAYTDLQRDRPSTLEEPLQYADLAEWQHQWLEAEAATVGKDYWRQQDFSGFERLQLPGESTAIESTDFEPQVRTLDFSPELTAKIAALVQTYNLSTATFLLTCWQIFLWRLTAQPELIVGVCYDGRSDAELEPAIGLLARYIPLQCHLASSIPACDQLQQVHQIMQEVVQWQEYFTWDCVTSPNLSNHHSLFFFPFCFEFEILPASYTIGDLSLAIEQIHTCIDRFNLKLSCVQKEETIVLSFVYNNYRFSANDIQRLAEQFQVLLNSIVDHPTAPIAELDILSPIERQQLLIEFNQTQIETLEYPFLHQWFERQVERTPDRIAVVLGSQQLTYQELNARANQLAHYLIDLGIGAETLVGICMERSLEMLVGIFGILKAGGAYVPIDPGLPSERKAFIMQDTRLPVLLTQERLLNKLPTTKAQLVFLDSQWQSTAQSAQSAQSSECNPACLLVPENLAYVIYTSGSTGTPKGTQICHQGLSNYLAWCTQAYAVEQGEGSLVHSPLGFDLTITSLFSPLLVGRRVELLPEDGDINALRTALQRRSNYSLVKLTPAHLALLNQQFAPETVAGQTRALIIGGEHLLSQTTEFWQTYAPGTKLVNEYGPTETVVGCCTYTVSPDTPAGSIPIGRPIANTQLYVLNSHLQPVPPGVAGELYIGGIGLARGYLNRPDLTAERFIPNPFSEQPGDRLYKTGDIVRHCPDGNLEYLGRTDHQVKIRGFRIELAEIETVLSQHGSVQEAIVMVHTDASGHSRLVAYFVPSPPVPSVGNLRHFLQKYLPDYMIPSLFVRLAELPITANGKIDRASVAEQYRPLPSPETPRGLDSIFVAPRNPVEQQLAAIWSQVLGLDAVGIHDNFFELGGDSIIAIQITAKAHQVNLLFTPQHLFQHSTIAELAAVSTSPILAANSMAQPIDQTPVTGVVPLTPIQHWCLEHLVNPHHYNQAVLLEARQPLNPVLLEQVVQQLLVYHDALRMRFERTALGWQQTNTSLDDSLNAGTPFLRVDLSALPLSEQRSALEAKATELQTTLHLTNGPLLRVVLFHLGHQPDRLLIIIHHLVVDGVSWRILLDDLQTAYQQLSQGNDIQLPLKTTSFQQWAHHLHQHAQSAALRQELDLWLADPRQQVSPLPVDYPAGENTTASTQMVSVALTVEETQALLQVIPARYHTQINDVLLAALAHSFAQWTGSDRLLVDLEGHGREPLFDADVTRTVGFFTSLFPVLLQATASMPLEAALTTMKDQLQAIPNHGIGYSILRYLSTDPQIRTSLCAMPQAEVRFNYLGQSDAIFSESSQWVPASESSGLTTSLEGDRAYLIDINSIVAGQQLQVDWSYSTNLYQAATIDGLAQTFINGLRSLIQHCSAPKMLSANPVSSFSPDQLQIAFASVEFEA
jgi:amino acid adenylation domain-containing protein/non-ribosomal peptide synthase protein (TIGR01720 family)